MEKLGGKQMQRKNAIALSCILLLCIAFVANNLWSSSSRISSFYPFFDSPTSLPNSTKTNSKIKIDHTTTPNYLNATFADLEAPQLEWEEMPSAPVPRLDGAAIQIKNLLYVFAGYGNINYVRILLLFALITL